MICYTCKTDKPEEEFNWRSKAKGTRNRQCRQCNKLYKDAYYQLNKEKVVADVLSRQHERRDNFQAWKAERGCLKCPENDPACLDLHHVDDNKEYGIAEMVRNYSWETVLKEIEKCVILCSNCHRKYHAGRLEL